MTSVLTTTDPQSVIERLMAEEPIALVEAARLFGSFKGGKAIHPATVTRWATAGVSAPDGSRIRLEVIRVGARLLTSRPAVLRFLQAQQSTPSDTPSPAPPRAPSRRLRASSAAGDELAKAGV